MMRVFFLVAFIALFSPLHAQTPSPSALPSLEQRVADLEAYINNSARGADTGSPVISNVAGPGPGHNAWMMTCAALVLFMTLPGLALFYGGLVRAKNVLSVLAQCLRNVPIDVRDHHAGLNHRLSCSEHDPRRRHDFWPRLDACVPPSKRP